MSPQGARAHSLLVGLDGADLGVIERLGPTRLPNLFAAMLGGAHAALASVQPPATLPNWTTLLTGVGPGHHGVFDFTVRDGYRVRFTGGSVREAPTLAARLDQLGKPCACLFFPATYPPDRLQHGVFISGWDAPVAFSADASFVWPRHLHAELLARFGPQRFDDVDEFAADARGDWHARLPDALIARIERRCELALWLLSQRPWQLFAVYFGESDTASHYLWSLWDECSPRHPGSVSEALRDGLPRVYEALDRALGQLWQAAGGEAVELTVASDHGSGGSSADVLYLNRALQQAGFLRMREASPARPSLAALIKEQALRRLPARLRERVFRAANARLPSLLESKVRFGAIDMKRSALFSDELNYFPAIHYNLRGREPHGTLAPADRERVRAELTCALGELRNPITGEPVVRAVHAREALYQGPFVERAPDLLLELELSSGYSYNLMPSASAPTAAVFRRLSPDEFLGRKGRSLPGSHRPHGLFIAAGPSVQRRGRIEAGIADASASLLARMGIAPPEGGGRALDLGASAPIGALPQAPLPQAPMADGDRPGHAGQVGHAGDEARVAARLRNLGYIE
jgi:predicted AlkP superfamily phosphohydrolase/phosphomutase